MSERIRQLEERFLRPDRDALEALRARAREADDVAGLEAALREDCWFSEDWEDSGPRSYRLSRSQGRDRPDARQVITRDTSKEAVWPRPGDLAAASLLWADPSGMRRAEDAAREAARRVWAAAGEEGPPQEVVWRISGWGSAPSSARPSKNPVIRHLTELGALGRYDPRPEAWAPESFVPAFQLLLRWHHEALEWDRRGGENPFAALLDVWTTGYGVWAINEEVIVLFAPERPGVTRKEDASEEWLLRQRAWAQKTLARACEQGDVDLARVALERGALPGATEYGGPPLHLCARRLVRDDDAAEVFRDLEAVVRLLLEAGADPGRRWNRGNALLARAEQHPVEACQPFLDGGLFVDARDESGQTALHQAARVSMVRTVERLLVLGCDPDLRDREGFSPIARAVARGADGIVERLWPVSDLSTTTADGRSLYHLVAMGFGEDGGAWVRRLGAAGVPNRPDGHGWTPDQLLPDGVELPFPPARPTPILSGGVLAAHVPPALVPEAQDDEGWAVLSDWLQQQGDPRGLWIATSAAVEHDPSREQRRWLHRALSAAHGCGAFVRSDPGVAVRWFHGVPWGLKVRDGRRYVEGLPDLLASPALSALRGVVVRAPSAVPLPGLLGVPACTRVVVTFTDGSDGPSAPLNLLAERLPALEHLVVKCRAPRSLNVVHPTLQTLHLEAPYLPEWTDWPGPLETLDTPELETLGLVMARAPHERETPEAMRVLGALFQTPPSALRHLVLRPTTPDLARRLVSSPLFEQLDRVDFLSVQEPFLAYLEAHAEALVGGPEIRVKSLGRRDERQAWRERLQATLPGLELSGIAYRNVGMLG